MPDDSSDQPPLPADVNNWPTDPQTVLGVSSGVSRRDLKRAYARLIKKYKPEHAPEEFRRLRAAFEQLDRQLEWTEEYDLRRRLFAEESDRPTESSTPSSPRTPPPPEPEPQPTAPSQPPRPTIEIRGPRDDASQRPDRTDDDNRDKDNQDGGDGAAPETVASEANAGQRGGSRSQEPDELWQLALDGGDLPFVYAALVAARRQRSPSEIDFARLYWLTTLVADLDPDRDPCTWLIEGLRYHRSSARLFEMLETEVRRRDGHVPAMLEDGLLDPGDVARRRVSFAEVRWFAARRQGRFDVISEDFQSLKRTFLDEPDQWLRLLNVGLRHVMLSHSVGLIEQFRHELQQAPSHAGNDWIWDSLEAALKLDEAWSAPHEALRNSPWGVSQRLRDILNLIETTWELPAIDAREAVLKVCVELAEDPRRVLREMSMIERDARPLLKRLQELLAQQLSLAGIDTVTEQTPEVRQELHRFIRTSFPEGNREDFGLTVLEYCLFQAVTPRDIAAALSEMTVTIPDEYFAIAEKLTTNLALNCIINAHRLLW